MQERFDVVEVEIKNPLNRRVMERGLSRDDADAYVKMAVYRRGVETHFYKAVAAGTLGAVAQYERISMRGMTLHPKETFGTATLYCDDCRYVLPELGPVDLVLTDPPYGMTDAKWDTAPNIGEMWAALKNGREDATFILTASQPFTSRVVMGNEKDFRVEWIWEKNAGSNFGTVKVQPMKEHESVLVFSRKPPIYQPIMQERAPSGLSRVKTVVNYDSQPDAYSGITGQASSLRPDLRYPRSIQKFNRERGLHPNQKPVALLEYLINTYTKPGDTVLDPYMGSGSTGIACRNTGRKFIGIEIEQKYYDIACNRMNG